MFFSFYGCCNHRDMKNVDFVSLLQLPAVSVHSIPLKIFVSCRILYGLGIVQGKPGAPSRCDKYNPSRLCSNNSQERLTAMLRVRGRIVRHSKILLSSATYARGKSRHWVSLPLSIYNGSAKKIDFTLFSRDREKLFVFYSSILRDFET